MTVGDGHLKDDAGYVRLWRKVTDNPVWTTLEPSVLKVMMGFLLKANWKQKTWYDGRATIEIPRGAFVTSYAKMAEFCNLSVKQIRLAFVHLEKLDFAAYTRASKWTLVKVLNYDIYQTPNVDEGTDQDTTEGSLRAGSGQGEGTMRATTKEFKNLITTTCASDDARAGGSLPSIEDPPFSTLESAVLFSDGKKNGHRKPAALLNGHLTAQHDAWFDEWWAIYWRHTAKKAARDAFRKHVRTEERFQRVMAATSTQASEMHGREPSKRPHGATWLNGERWTDEAEQPRQQAQRASDDYPELTA